MNITHPSPRLNPTESGENNVEFEGRLLYSRYSPEKGVLRTVDAFQPNGASLVLAFSPLLGYGLKALLAKIPADSFVLGIEADDALFEFSQPFLKNFSCYENFAYKNFKTAEDFGNFLEKEVNFGRFKTLQFLNLSGGNFFHKDFYEKLCFLGENLIFSFWKNRITLISLGKLFCKNFFKNLSLLSRARPPAFRSIEAPILVLGAGISCDEIFYSGILRKGNFFIIAVDVTAVALAKLGIPCNLIVLTEGQQAIDKAFVGISRNTALLCDLASRPAIARQFDHLGLTFLQFAQSKFLQRISEETFMPRPFSPLGSVGLDAMRMACLLRKGPDVPVIFSGIDFSYPLGKSHFCGSAQSIVANTNSRRLAPLQSIPRREDLFETSSPGFFSDKIMDAYGDLFRSYFACEKNVFDASFMERSPFEKICPGSIGDFSWGKKVTEQPFQEKPFATKTEIQNFFATEKEKLILLEEKIRCGYYKETFQSLPKHDYLYLHFPDGHNPKAESNFMNRVATQIREFIPLMKN